MDLCTILYIEGEILTEAFFAEWSKQKQRCSAAHDAFHNPLSDYIATTFLNIQPSAPPQLSLPIATIRTPNADRW